MEKCKYYKMGLKTIKSGDGCGAYDYREIEIPYSYCDDTGKECACGGFKGHCDEKKIINKKRTE